MYIIFIPREAGNGCQKKITDIFKRRSSVQINQQNPKPFRVEAFLLLGKWNGSNLLNLLAPQNTFFFMWTNYRWIEAIWNNMSQNRNLPKMRGTQGTFETTTKETSTPTPHLSGARFAYFLRDVPVKPHANSIGQSWKPFQRFGCNQLSFPHGWRHKESFQRHCTFTSLSPFCVKPSFGIGPTYFYHSPACSRFKKWLTRRSYNRTTKDITTSPFAHCNGNMDISKVVHLLYRKTVANKFETNKWCCPRNPIVVNVASSTQGWNTGFMKRAITHPGNGWPPSEFPLTKTKSSSMSVLGALC